MNNEEKKEPSQNELRDFVSREIGECQSYLIDELLKTDFFCYDDIVNLYIDNSDKIKEIEEKIDELELLTEESEEATTEIEELQAEIDELIQEQEAPQEIFEWWTASKWLLNRLEEQGEPILKTDFGEWWGRTTTGQAILLDYVIEKIYKELK